MKLITTTTEENILKVIGFANALSLIENRFQSGETITSTIATPTKHTKEELWWFNYTAVYEHLGVQGKPMADMLTGTTPDGEPNINPKVFKVIEVAQEDLIPLGYLEAAPDNIENEEGGLKSYFKRIFS